MRIVKCGQQGLTVGQLGLGCMGMSGTYGAVDEQRSLSVLHAAVEAEVLFWDTADVYGSGRNERLLARVISTDRARFVLASKGGITGRNADGLTVNGRPDYLHRACRESLKRLQTPYLDLYYLHRIDPDVPVEESVGALGELVSQGLVRFVGLSEASASTIRRGHAEFPLSAVQSEYSLLTRDLETTVLPTLRELGIGLVAYSPIGRGLLAGAIQKQSDLPSDDFRRELPRFTDENLLKNSPLIQRVRDLARRRGSTVVQVALAWLLAQDGVVPIPGTTQASRVFENAQACGLALSQEEIAYLDFPSGSVSGARYPESLERAAGL